MDPTSSDLGNNEQPPDLDKQKQDAIEMANKLWQVLTHVEQFKQASAEARHEWVVENAKSFAQAFPLVAAKMAREFRYKEKAFVKFLDKMYADPGKGMDGVIENQANYAKFLYIEECRAAGKHVNYKIAKQVWEQEHGNMSAWVKKIKKSEKQAKNEYTEEEQKHTQERRAELLEFIRKTSNHQSQTENQEDQQERQNILNELKSQVNQHREQHPEPPTEPEFTETEQTDQEIDPELEKQIQQRLKQEKHMQEEKRRQEFLQDTMLPGFKKQHNKSKKHK